MTIGKRIKSLREDLKLTQDELAKLMGVNRSSLANYESNLREPKGEILVRFAETFGTTTDYLLGRTDDPYSYKAVKPVRYVIDEGEEDIDKEGLINFIERTVAEILEERNKK